MDDLQGKDRDNWIMSKKQWYAQKNGAEMSNSDNSDEKLSSEVEGLEWDSDEELSFDDESATSDIELDMLVERALEIMDEWNGLQKAEAKALITADRKEEGWDEKRAKLERKQARPLDEDFLYDSEGIEYSDEAFRDMIQKTDKNRLWFRGPSR